MTAKPIKRKSDKPVSIQGYDGLLSGMVSLIEEARRVSARTVNAIMTATYWEIGRRIVENEQGGKRRAGYGEALLKQLSADLASRFGRGFAKSNLYQMRTFYLTYQDIFQTAFGKSKSRKFQTPSGKSQPHNSDENPPVGLILCAMKNSALAKYALQGLPNKVLAAEYKTVLPDEKLIAEELKRTRKLLEERKR